MPIECVVCQELHVLVSSMRRCQWTFTGSHVTITEQSHELIHSHWMQQTYHTPPHAIPVTLSTVCVCVCVCVCACACVTINKMAFGNWN